MAAAPTSLTALLSVSDKTGVLDFARSLHDMIMNTVEKPLLDVVLRHADGNQSRAAEWLGINRNTLRRKLLDHKLVK